MIYAGFKTTVPLRDLAEVKRDWAGILSPTYPDELVQKFIHSQFVENASNYVDRYQNVPYWTQLLTAAEAQINLKALEAPWIVDVGSGGGNTIFPLFKIYPQAHISASDLSVPLMKILQTLIQREHPGRECLLLQMNAEQMVFESNQIDLVTGGAILHHLFAPEKTLSECYRVLKPGGAAVFFEPFEMGNQMIALLMRNLVRMNENVSLNRIEPGIVAFFKMLYEDFKLRKGSDKSNPVFEKMDDKWIFTRTHLTHTAKAIGFRDLLVEPIHLTQNMFSNQMQTYLRLGLAKDYNALPAWAREMIRETDEQFSDESKNELIIEGRIILRK